MNLHKWHRLVICYAVLASVASAWTLGTYQPTSARITAVFEALPQWLWAVWFLVAASVTLAAWKWPECWKVGLSLTFTGLGAWAALYGYFLFQAPSGAILWTFSAIAAGAFLILVAAPVRAFRS